MVSDSGKGVATVKVSSDRYAGIDFAALLDAGRWSASLPLEVDSNLLTIIASDKVGNQASVTVSVLRESANAVLGLTIDYPRTNAVLTTDTIVVRGILRSGVPALQMAVQVNGKAATLGKTDNNTDFTFQSPPLTLSEGINNILVQATVDGQPLQRPHPRLGVERAKLRTPQVHAAYGETRTLAEAVAHGQGPAEGQIRGYLYPGVAA